jgi:hypothetical protein
LFDDIFICILFVFLYIECRINLFRVEAARNN